MRRAQRARTFGGSYLHFFGHIREVSEIHAKHRVHEAKSWRRCQNQEINVGRIKAELGGTGRCLGPIGVTKRQCERIVEVLVE